MPFSKCPGRVPGPSVALLVLALAGSMSPAGGQTAVLRTAENFRATPNGVLLGRIAPGARLAATGSREGRWIEVTAEGWVWEESLQARGPRSSWDLHVSAADGENLRASPRGAVIGRLETRTLLNEVAREPGWIRVRRTGWIWAPSVEIEEPPAKATAPERAPGPAPEPPGEWVRTGPAGAAVLSAPDGDTLAAAARGAELRVLGREGNWTRVRIEGWVWGPSIPEDGAPTLVAATPGEVAADPGSFRGKLVQWDLRFISLERAEQVRTDFYPGEPFLLTRTITGGDRFVYVAVPPDRLEEVRALAPLERIRIVGRIRTAAAAHTGSPILDLLELRRPGGP